MRRLADDQITLTLGSQRFTLRASLRAVAIIARDYHDFAALYADIAGLSLSACLALIEATCTDPKRFALFAAVTTDRPLQNAISQIQPQLLAFIEAISGANEPISATPSDPITLDELVTRLFMIGAGWLEWPTSEVWNATMSEILLARDGLIEKLKAIHGGKDDNDDNVIDFNKRKVEQSTRDQLNAVGDLTKHSVI